MAETRGRKPTYSDPNFLKQKIDEYFNECEAKNEFADAAGMRRYLKLTKRQVSELCDEENNPNAEKYIQIFEEAQDRRESWLMRRMVAEPKSANGCMNALKQKDNGGYTDRPAPSVGDNTIKVIVQGGGENLFK